MPIRVTIWNERANEPDFAQHVYPGGKQHTIKEFLSRDKNISATAVSMDEPEQGLPDEILENTDVLIWWGHSRHHEVSETLTQKITKRVLSGKMGFIPLHSSHLSKPFTRLVGTSGLLHWGDNQREVVWTVLPAHPIAKDIPEHFILSEEEMYGEPFDIPQPDELVFMSWFINGYVFRSGCVFFRGNGKIFYFQPGHETCPSYHNENVQKIITNAVYWAAPAKDAKRLTEKDMHITLNFSN